MNDQDQTQGYNHGHSKTVKCLINIQPPYIIEKNGEYSGVIYDAWKKANKFGYIFNICLYKIIKLNG